MLQWEKKVLHFYMRKAIMLHVMRRKTDISFVKKNHLVIWRVKWTDMLLRRISPNLGELQKGAYNTYVSTIESLAQFELEICGLSLQTQ